MRFVPAGRMSDEVLTAPASRRVHLHPLHRPGDRRVPHRTARQARSSACVAPTVGCIVPAIDYDPVTSEDLSDYVDGRRHRRRHDLVVERQPDQGSAARPAVRVGAGEVRRRRHRVPRGGRRRRRPSEISTGTKVKARWADERDRLDPRPDLLRGDVMTDRRHRGTRPGHDRRDSDLARLQLHAGRRGVALPAIARAGQARRAALPEVPEGLRPAARRLLDVRGRDRRGASSSPARARSRRSA